MCLCGYIYVCVCVKVSTTANILLLVNVQEDLRKPTCTQILLQVFTCLVCANSVLFISASERVPREPEVHLVPGAGNLRP